MVYTQTYIHIFTCASCIYSYIRTRGNYQGIPWGIPTIYTYSPGAVLRRPRKFLVCIGASSKKTPRISGFLAHKRPGMSVSFAQRDLQLNAFYAYLPPLCQGV